MSLAYLDDIILSDIADAIRAKRDISNTFIPSEMASAILQIITQSPDYTGAYTVTPTSSDQTLATANKHMTNDVTVFKIPKNVETNTAGGQTVTIG